MTIQNNKFIRCAEPVIHIEPRNQKANDSVHQNITIVNNEFLLHNELIVDAKSAKSLTVAGNSIISEKKLDNEKSIKTSDCSLLKIGKNQYKNYSN
jgi:hypothetical protein